jgi:RNA polymerase sigma factor (TIGR02999 family)
MAQEDHVITQLLHRWRDGDQDAGNQVMAHMYTELRHLAAHYMRYERTDHTLQPTALVNELYLKLSAGQSADWKDRAHFIAVAARQLRLILVDHARRNKADRRGGGQLKVQLDQVGEWTGPRDEELLALDAALRRLEEMDARSAKVVELRFFGGLTEEEAAEVLGVSVVTLKRDWSFARAWLLAQLGPQALPE